MHPGVRTSSRMGHAGRGATQRPERKWRNGEAQSGSGGGGHAHVGDADRLRGWGRHRCLLRLTRGLPSPTSAASTAATSANFEKAFDTLHELADEAPDDVKDDWEVLDGALTDMEKALQDAGIKISDLEGMVNNGEIPEGVDMEKLATLSEDLRRDHVREGRGGRQQHREARQGRVRRRPQRELIGTAQPRSAPAAPTGRRRRCPTIRTCLDDASVRADTGRTRD